MKSNVWLRLVWNDYQLQWDEADYGGISVLRLPPDKVWKPDIVLFNKYEHIKNISSYSTKKLFISTIRITNLILTHLITNFQHCSADGNYEVRYKSNVLIYPDGEVLWVPPAIYQVPLFSLRLYYMYINRDNFHFFSYLL